MFDVLFDIMQWNFYDGGSPIGSVRCGDGIGWVVGVVGLVLFVAWAWSD